MVLWGSVSQLRFCLKETMRGINVKMSKERMLINEASNVTHPMTENSFETLKKKCPCPCLFIQNKQQQHKYDSGIIWEGRQS